MKCFHAMDNVIKVADGYIFVSLYNNRIYKIFDENLHVKPISQIPFSYENIYMEYSKVYEWNNKLFVLPWFSDSIAIYDICDDSYRFIKLDGEFRGLRYLKAYQKQEYLYLIPCENKDIVIFNMQTEKIIDRLPVKVSKENEKKVIAWCEICCDEDSLIIPQVYDNKLIKFSIADKRICYEEKIKESDGFCGICDTHGGRWYVPRKADSIYFEKDGKIDKIFNFPEGYIPGEISFYKIVPDEHRVFLLPRDSNMFLVVYENGLIFNLMNTNPNMQNDMERYMYFSNVWKMWGKWFCIEAGSGNLYEISNDNRLIQNAFLDEENYKCEIDTNKLLFENPYIEHTLENYIAAIIGE